MVTPEEIKKKATAQFAAYLNSLYNETEGPFFPLVIKCDKKMDFNTPRELEESITKLQAFSTEKRAYGYTIRYELKTSKRFASQNVPKTIFMASEQNFLKFIGMETDALQFREVTDRVLQEFPQLKDCMIKNYRLVIKYYSDWDNLLKVCRYFREHPQPDLFVRELQAGVHTKFVETHKDILRQLLDVIVGDDKVDHNATTFYGHFHLKEGDPQISFRIVDRELSRHYLAGLTFCTVYVCEFAQLHLPVSQVIIVENKRNLSQVIDLIPDLPNTLVIWGCGYMVNVLKYVEWLHHTRIYYWGDIDAQGYEILSNIREHFPNITSVMMDQATMDIHPTRTDGTPSTVSKTLRLNEEEYKVYLHVKEHVLRFEQDQLPESYVCGCLNEL